MTTDKSHYITVSAVQVINLIAQNYGQDVPSGTYRHKLRAERNEHGKMEKLVLEMTPIENMGEG